MQGYLEEEEFRVKKFTEETVLEKIEKEHN
jgi:hypothetical protein